MKQEKYCSKCGLKLVIDKTVFSYNSQTGKKEYWRLYCPAKLGFFEQSHTDINTYNFNYDYKPLKTKGYKFVNVKI